jgi:hypothetical protein
MRSRHAIAGSKETQKQVGDWFRRDGREHGEPADGDDTIANVGAHLEAGDVVIDE